MCVLLIGIVIGVIGTVSYLKFADLLLTVEQRDELTFLDYM